MSEWTPVGAQMLRNEGDLVFIRLCGVLSLLEAKALLASVHQLSEQHGRLYVLFDNSQVGTIEPAARRFFVEWHKENAIAAVANFGGGVMQRALAFLLYNAIRLVNRNAPLFTYVATEAQARTWIEAQRSNPQR